MQLPRVSDFLTPGKVILLFILLVLALGAAAFWLLNNERVAYVADDPAHNRTYWKQEIARTGSAGAYAEFKKVNADAPEGERHLSSHVIGGLIAEAEGPEGIAICDASFGFGCYHGFFGEIISNGGLGLVEELDRACVAAYGKWGTGCQHGIGHGVLEYLGTQRLAEALEVCTKTSQPAPLMGCTTGVFMEYDFPLSEGADATTRRSFDPADPYHPCTTVKSEFKDACYMELGQWYRITFGADAAQIGSLCGALPERERTHCFLGVGSMQGSFENYDAEHAIALCKEFGTEDEFRCRAGAWWSFYQVPEQRSKGEPTCGYADPDIRAACRKLGDFTGGLAS